MGFYPPRACENEGMPGDAAVDAKDPLAEARFRGAAEQRRLLGEARGAVGATEAAEFLGISGGAVDARRKRNKLLAVDTGRRGCRYPRCQFDAGSKDGVVRGLDRVIAAVGDPSGWIARRHHQGSPDDLRRIVR